MDGAFAVRQAACGRHRQKPGICIIAPLMVGAGAMSSLLQRIQHGLQEPPKELRRWRWSSSSISSRFSCFFFFKLSQHFPLFISLFLRFFVCMPTEGFFLKYIYLYIKTKNTRKRGFGEGLGRQRSKEAGVKYYSSDTISPRCSVKREIGK